MFVLMAVGCGLSGPAGALTARSLSDDPVAVDASFVTSLYFHEPDGESWFVLSDVPFSDLVNGRITRGQFLRIQWLWSPRPGSTPMDRNATNVSVRYVVVADGELGIYEGGGFALDGGDIGDRTVTLTLRDASLVLSEATAGFNDLLSPAALTGRFTAERRNDRAQMLRYAMSQFVTNRLGRPWRADATGLPPLAAGVPADQFVSAHKKARR